MTKETVKITTLLSFITQIQKFESQSDHTYFYRGHSDSRYKLQPSIYRNHGYLENEDVMFNELITHNPSEFLSCRNAIDYLVKMQHYGLPTRLLDITTNPLISLFFACSDVKADVINLKKGEVIMFKVPNNQIKYSDSDTVAVLSNIAKMKKDFCFESVNDKTEFNEQDSIQYLLHSIRQEKGSFQDVINMDHMKSAICVKAKMDNPRIVNQSGAFFLFGCNNKNKGFVDIDNSWIASEKRLIITNKKGILDDLKLMGITEKFVYPNLEKYTDFLRNSYFRKEEIISEQTF